MIVNFSEVKIGQEFWADGCMWFKKTENSAETQHSSGLAGFAPNERVQIAK